MTRHPNSDSVYVLAHFHHSPIQVAGGRPGVGVPFEVMRQPTRISNERELAGLVRLDLERSAPIRFYLGRFIGKDASGAHLFEPVRRLCVSRLDLEETDGTAPGENAVRLHLSGEAQIDPEDEPALAGPRP